jgi:hypothetical protein
LSFLLIALRPVRPVGSTKSGIIQAAHPSHHGVVWKSASEGTVFGVVVDVVPDGLSLTPVDPSTGLITTAHPTITGCDDLAGTYQH